MILPTRYGNFGGTFVPETLMPALEELEAGFVKAIEDNSFTSELNSLLANYAGRPTPLYFARNLSAAYGCEIYLKREDLLHGGAHKTNNAIGQALLARYIGKKRLVAETGAGQHGVATAMAGAMMSMPVDVYMGELDVERQSQNVDRMKLLGATVHPVSKGSRTLKDAINDAMRDWVSNLDDTHYVLGTAAGPHPFPTLVKHFQAIIGVEAHEQFQSQAGAAPDAVVACIGGGSNAIGIFTRFIPEKNVSLVGVEPAGDGLDSPRHGAVLSAGRTGCVHGMTSMVLQDRYGQIHETHSIAAGLDYPSVGPEHAYLREIGRVKYESATDVEALDAFRDLCRLEGIIPALESSHALAYVKNAGRETLRGKRVIINLSGRGDKDISRVIEDER